MANLLQSIGIKIRQGYNWIKAKAQAIATRIEAWYERYKEYRAAIKRHREYLDSVLDSSQEYTPEPCDVQLQQKMKQCIDRLEDGKLLEHIKSLPFEKRKEYFETVLLPAVCSEMGVMPQFLGWFQDESTAGFYCEQQHGIALNEMFLACNSDYALRIMINTVIHESKHAMQWDAVAGRNTHGYSAKLIDEWRSNFNDYISFAESDEGYTKQPVEWDASCFAESVYTTDEK